MPFHDAYARRTPFELAFPDPDAAADRLGRIREDARERDQADALAEPGRFPALPAVAEVLQEIRQPGTDAEALQKHAVLLYQLFHFHEAGRPLYLVGTHVARYLVESAGPGDEEAPSGEGPPPPAPPAPAGYVQLPRQLFWVRPSEEGPPEPVDGLFWAAPDGERIATLVAAGMRGDRPGLSVVPLPAVPLDESASWLGAGIRPGGRDFESTLPGGELERLYSLEAAGEVLKLLARFFRYLERFPDAVLHDDPAGAPGPEGEGRDRESEETEPGGDPEAGGGKPAGAGPPDPSALPYRRVVLEGRPEDSTSDPMTGGGNE